jgi:hypothetical protein
VECAVLRNEAVTVAHEGHSARRIYRLK